MGRKTKSAARAPVPQPAQEIVQDDKICSVCGITLSAYNPGPNCWQHTIGYPWRGPSAKPRYD